MHAPALVPAVEGSCTFEGRWYRDGDDWKPDACTSCVCNGGRVQCAQSGDCNAGERTAMAPRSEPPRNNIRSLLRFK